MSWEYRLAKKVQNVVHPIDGEKEYTTYGIVEVYYDNTGAVDGWTDFINPNDWDNTEDLKLTLEKMLKAFDKPMFEETIYNHEEE